MNEEASKNDSAGNDSAPRGSATRIFGLIDLEELLKTPVTTADLLATLTPLKHFRHATFQSYQPDSRFPSQRAAMQSVQEWIRTASKKKGRISTFVGQLRRTRELSLPRGVYLDGGFGIGKSHLLASAYHAFDGKKAYLSFQELMFIVGLQTLATTARSFETYALLCIDEFELDDPANTRIASNLIGKLMQAGVRILTTSNTPPGALGENKFSVTDFARELQDLASGFETIRIEGEDYRTKSISAPRAESQLAGAGELKAASILRLEFRELMKALGASHPMRVRNALKQFDFVELSRVVPIDSPNEALRFVYFIDKAYDYDLGLLLERSFEIPSIFSSSVRQGADDKKFRRAISRMQEMRKDT